MASRGFVELLRLADLARLREANRDNQSDSQWVGVIFEVAGHRFIAPMGEVSEVLAMPSAVTPVPMSQPWLIGVANIRGRLLPLTDLTEFLGLPAPQKFTANKKIIVIDEPEIFAGLQVDQVLGIQQFSTANYVPQTLPKGSPFLPYNHGKFVSDDQELFVFMPSLLVEDPRFLEAAV